MTKYKYQVGGSLAADAPSYVKRRADSQLYDALQEGEFCYVLSSRQMGKSSLLVQTKSRLQQEGFQCVSIDLSIIVGNSVTPLQWYKGLVSDLWLGFKLLNTINLKSWWEQEADISFIQRLRLFIEEILLSHFPDKKLVIFIDEIDSVLNLDFSVDDFFILIRYFYNQRAVNPEYSRISFAIFGVATPSNFIQEPTKTPFNIGKAIELEGFKLDEATPLIDGFKQKVERPQIVLKQILAWTGGQPFLTQKLCNLILQLDQLPSEKPKIIAIPPGTEAFWVENLVTTCITYNWESQDQPEHLRTIRDRLLWDEQQAGRTLCLYQKLLQNVKISIDDSREQMELLLSGLVIKHQGYLKIKNLIYPAVFNLDWVKQQLDNLRPYSYALNAWLASGRTDESRLLRGQALKDAQEWSQNKSLSDLDYQFLAACQALDRQEMEKTLEAARTKEVEARLIVEQKRILQQRRANRILAFLTCGMTIKFVVFLWLWLHTLSQYHQATADLYQAREDEIKALIASSQGHLATHQSFTALIDAIRAKRSLQKLETVNPNLENQTNQLLQQAVQAAKTSQDLKTQPPEPTSPANSLSLGCNLLQKYLQTNPDATQSDRQLCN
jgi:hypothetical protein